MASSACLRVWENAAVRGDELFAGLKVLKDKYDVVGDVRGGEGLMCALELVSDRATKQPCGKDVPLKVQKAAYEDGVMIRVFGNNIILSPPLIITSEHVTKILSAIEIGLKSM